MDYADFVKLNNETKECLLWVNEKRTARILRVGKFECVDMSGRQCCDSKLVVEVSHNGKICERNMTITLSGLINSLSIRSFYVTNPSVLRNWAGWRYNEMSSGALVLGRRVGARRWM